MDGIARSVAARGFEAAGVATELADGLRGDGLKLVVAFADWRIDMAVFARELQRALPAPVVGCTTIGVIGGGIGRGTEAESPSAAAIGFYGDSVRPGIGI